MSTEVEKGYVQGRICYRRAWAAIGHKKGEKKPEERQQKTDGTKREKPRQERLLDALAEGKACGKGKDNAHVPEVVKAERQIERLGSTRGGATYGYVYAKKLLPS